MEFYESFMKFSFKDDDIFRIEEDPFRDALHEVIQQWNIKDSNVKVFNEATALEHQLIVAYIPKSERDSARESNGNMSKELAQQWFDSHNPD